MSVDMGGIRWPIRGAAVPLPTLGSAKLDRNVAYQGNNLFITATATNGTPHTGPFEVVLTPREGGDPVRPRVEGNTVVLSGTPKNKYEVWINGIPAGLLAVL